MSDHRAARQRLSIRSDELRRDSADLVRDSNHLRVHSRKLLDTLRLLKRKQAPELSEGNST